MTNSSLSESVTMFWLDETSCAKKQQKHWQNRRFNFVSRGFPKFREHTHTHTHARTHARTHAHTHTHIYINTNTLKYTGVASVSIRQALLHYPLDRLCFVITWTGRGSLSLRL